MYQIAFSILITAGVAGIGYLYRRKIKKLLKGKKIAVLGESGVGKTTLITFLTNGELPSSTKATVRTETASQESGLRLEELELVLKDIKDVSGQKNGLGEWKKSTQDSDFIFYLVRADRIFENDESAVKRLIEDMKHLENWIKESQASVKSKTKQLTYLIGTHCDLDPAYSVTPLGEYYTRFQNLQCIKQARARVGINSIFLGSLVDLESTQNLVASIIQATKTE